EPTQVQNAAVEAVHVGKAKTATQAMRERQPGDDTEQEKADKKAERQAKKNNGKPIFSFTEFNKHFGYVARGPEDIANAYPEFKNLEKFRACEQLLRDFRKLWDGLHKEIKK